MSFQRAGGTLKINAPLSSFKGRTVDIYGFQVSQLPYPFLTATYFLLASSLFHSRCSLGERTVLGTYLCLQKQRGATNSYREWDYDLILDNQSPLILRKWLKDDKQRSTHQHISHPSSYVMWALIHQAGLCSLALSLEGSLYISRIWQKDSHKRQWGFHLGLLYCSLCMRTLKQLCRKTNLVRTGARSLQPAPTCQL